LFITLGIVLKPGASMNQVSTRFLTRCFSPRETIALLLRRNNAPRAEQRVVRLEQVLQSHYLAWLAYENDAGANIYVSANPLHSGSRKRTKESVSSVRHLYIDIDTDGDHRLAALRSSDNIPMPTAILSTSPGKYQVLWRVDGFDIGIQEQTLKLLAFVFGGDSACTDCNRMLRLPGYLNHKYVPDHRVSVEYLSDSLWTPDDFRLDVARVDTTLLRVPFPYTKQRGKRTDSENDWAWICDQLAHGKDALKLTLELAVRRSDKPNPLYYAQRTVDVASARLWLTQGIRIEDAIAMLESRRRFEIPYALCSIRAREIVATAERMIAHR
jgi:hypothetical protein